jgi:DNA-binding NarL/FixJ family response regulator
MIPYSLLLVDDHQILLDGTRNLLESHPDFEVRGSASSGKAARELLAANTWDFMVVDFQLPDCTGLELLREARKIHPKIRVIALTMHDDPAIVREFIREQVDGFLLKSDSYDQLIHALERIAEGKKFYSPAIQEILAQEIADPRKPTIFTPRELEILRLIAQELTTLEISERLFISENTVETHRKNMLRKSDSKNWPGLIAWAYKQGIL